MTMIFNIVLILLGRGGGELADSLCMYTYYLHQNLLASLYVKSVHGKFLITL